jgi:hypothetical protein
VCKFCLNKDDQHYPCSAEQERKRKRTEHIKSFFPPWRSDNFSSHLRTKHASEYEAYKVLSVEEKQLCFLNTESDQVVNTRSFVHPEASIQAQLLAKQKCSFFIDSDIVTEIIGKLLFDKEVECPDGSISEVEQAKRNALSSFTSNERDGIFVVGVASILKMNMIVNFVSAGLSLRQATRLYSRSFTEETQRGVLGNISDTEVSKICRTVCAINLQYLKEILKDAWAFSIGLDAGNNAGMSYLDIRLRISVKDELHNLHFLAIPMTERHTGQYQFDLVVDALDVIAHNWRHQLIGVAIDGTSSMTGWVQGACTRLTRECHSSIFRICCGAHQLDLVMETAFAALCDDRFLTTVTGVAGHLRRQQNLIMEMHSTCPMFATARWISMGKFLKWVREKRTRLVKHFAQKKPLCKPSDEWWIVVSVIQPIVERVEKTLASLQGMNTLVCEQRRELSRLMCDLMERGHIKGPLTSEEIQAFTVAVEENPRHGIIIDGFCVKQESLIEAIDENGEFVQIEMDKLKARDSSKGYETVILTIATFLLQLVAGTSRIVQNETPTILHLMSSHLFSLLICA